MIIKGPSITTAWGITFNILASKTAFQSKKPLPILLSVLVGIQSVCYGKQTIETYFL